MQLMKIKLTAVVVSTSVLAYLLAAVTGDISFITILLLVTGGILVAGASNALNQIIEKDFDPLMERTKNRPVASGRMKTSEAVIIAGISSLLGVVLLACINVQAAFLAGISLVIYSFIYTPLKRYSTIAVAVGAIPGALPALIGVTAATGSISQLGLLLFGIQFMWQFPHFWAIGFLGFEDYKKAGFKLVPMADGLIDRKIGLHSFIYAFLLIPICFMYFFFGGSIVAATLGALTSIGYAYLSLRFYFEHNRISARRLMFFSFFYMPLIFIIYLVF